MRRSIVPLAALLVALAGGAPSAAAAAAPEGRPPRIVAVELRGIVFSISAGHVVDAIQKADAEGADLVLIEMDTPGGSVEATEDMVKAILNARTPVAAFVSPRAAHAASAGFFVLIAADVAAMAPVTRAGASSPIVPGQENRREDVALQKASEDLAALLREAARARGRNWEEAQLAVTQAKAWGAEEALKLELIDLIADDRDDLLRKLDGRAIVRARGGKPTTLRTEGATVVQHEMDWLGEVQSVLFHPIMLLLFFLGGVVGLYVEFTHPGLILPGVVGAVCLAIFLYGSQILPVNYLGAVLVAVAVVCFILEVKVTSYGMLTLAGLACLVAGTWILFPRDVPGMAIPLQVLVPVVAFVASLMLGVLWMVIRAQAARAVTGVEGMVGERGRATTALDPEGKVFVHGEYWNARAVRPIPAGGRVRVRAVEDMTLEVEPEEEGRA